MLHRKFKVLLCVLIALLNFNIFTNLSSSKVMASEINYLRVLSENVYLYQDKECTQKMFALPYGYFVKVESYNYNSCRVVYGEDNSYYPVIYGYVKTNEVKTVTKQPLKPFIVISTTTSVSDVLFSDAEKTRALFNLPAGSYLYLYGEQKLSSGNVVCYVYVNSKLGYVDKSSLNAYAFPETSDQIETPKEEIEEVLTPTPTETPTTFGEGIQIIIIVGISVISVSVVYVLFKPQKNVIHNQNADYLDE